MADLISRAAALEALGECPYNRDDWPEEIQAVDDWKSHKEAIESIPAVDAVPVVHGRWIEIDEGDGDYTYDCSVCGGKWWLAEDTPEANGMKYCPYCGAKMIGDT